MIFNIYEQNKYISSTNLDTLFKSKEQNDVVFDNDTDNDLDRSEFSKILECISDFSGESQLEDTVKNFVYCTLKLSKDLEGYIGAYKRIDPVDINKIKEVQDNFVISPYIEYINIIHSSSTFSFKSEVDRIKNRQIELDIKRYRNFIISKIFDKDDSYDEETTNRDFITTLYNFFRVAKESEESMTTEKLLLMAKDINNNFSVHRSMLDFDVSNAVKIVLEFYNSIKDENIEPIYEAEFSQLLYLYLILLSAKTDAIKEYVKYSNEVIDQFMHQYYPAEKGE